MPYKFVDEYTVADIAFEASGNTLEELFESAANATTNTQIEDLKKISTRKAVKFQVKSPDIEKLLHNFLQELIFYKDAKLILFKTYKLKLTPPKAKGKEYILEVEAKGETINPKKHEMLVDVKAVSWHMFKVEKRSDGGWRALVILDV